MGKVVHILDRSISLSQLARPIVPFVEEVLDVYALSAKNQTEAIQQQLVNNQF